MVPPNLLSNPTITKLPDQTNLMSDTNVKSEIKIKYEEEIVENAEIALDNFYHFYEARNSDLEYGSFLEYDKERVLESIVSKIFKVNLKFTEMKKYICLFYLFVHQDILQADFHYKSLGESDQDEIFRIFEQRTFDDKGETQHQRFRSLIKRLEDKWTESELISRLANLNH